MISTRLPAMRPRRTIPTLSLFLLLSLGGVLQVQNATAQSATVPPAAVQGGAGSSIAAAPQPAQAKQTSSSDDEEQYRHSAIVVKLGADLGMSPETAANVFTIINLLILGAGIGYGLLKFLPNAFRRRNLAIQKHLVDARSVTEEAKSRLTSVEERLARLDDQITAIRLQVEAESAREEERIKATVEDEKQKILAAAEAEIQSATTVARREIQRYAADLAIEHAARKLVVSAETDRLLVESFAHKLGEGSKN